MIEKEEKSAQNEQKTVKNEPFFIVPSKVFDLGLTPYEFAVLCYLIMRSDNDTHTCFPSEKGIARACGMGLSTVKNVVKQLQNKKHIIVKNQFAKSKNGLNRQTSNLYVLQLFDGSPAVNIEPPHSHEMAPPQPSDSREINKTIPNITKSNITKSTELSLDAAVDLEKERFSFMELKRGCFEVLKNERGFDDEYILLLDRALEHLWYKNNAEYEGIKYAQDELRALLGKNTTPDVLASSVESLSHPKEPIRSPVAYLAKCILGGLVNGTLQLPAQKDEDKTDPRSIFSMTLKPPQNSGNASSLDVNDFFAQALKNTYGDDFGF